MLIVGSQALIRHFNLPDRKVRDTDIIGTLVDFELLKKILNPKEIRQKDEIIGLIDITSSDLFPEINTKNVEILIADNSVSLKLYLDYDDANNEMKYASPEVLFSLKKSHIHFPVKFQKHISDYCLLYDHFKGDDMLYAITEINFKETEKRLGKLRTPSLNKSTKNFFGQSEKFFKSYFVHDDIHRMMSHYQHPLYENMQKDNSSARCEKNMWEKFTFEDKCKCVLEEAMVIALERKIIPMIFGGGEFFTADEALKWSLMRVCTTLCSGWFRQFATDNYMRIQQYINPNYVELFLTKYDEGLISKC
jgi:hypothetical protein